MKYIQNINIYTFSAKIEPKFTVPKNQFHQEYNEFMNNPRK